MRYTYGYTRECGWYYAYSVLCSTTGNISQCSSSFSTNIPHHSNEHVSTIFVYVFFAISKSTSSIADSNVLQYLMLGAVKIVCAFSEFICTNSLIECNWVTHLFNFFLKFHPWMFCNISQQLMICILIMTRKGLDRF